MNRGIRAAVAVAVLMLATACGGSDDAEPSKAAPTSSSAEPTPTESDDCRSAMDQADAIATELDTAEIEDGAAFRQYSDRLTALHAKASETCSARVLGDFSAALESMLRVEARYEACSFSDPMFQCDVSEDLVEGTGLVHSAATAANATS